MILHQVRALAKFLGFALPPEIKNDKTVEKFKAEQPETMHRKCNDYCTTSKAFILRIQFFFLLFVSPAVMGLVCIRTSYGNGILEWARGEGRMFVLNFCELFDVSGHQIIPKGYFSQLDSKSFTTT